MSKKKILTVAIALVLVAVIGVGTLAFFNDTKTVSNLFYTTTQPGPNPPGPNPPTPSSVFSIKLEETEFDEDGAATGNMTTTGNTYYKALPGSTFTKDPTVYNTGSLDQWVRVRVTITKTDAWAAAGIADPSVILNLNANWTINTSETVTDASAKTVTYYIYYANKLEPGVRDTDGNYTTEPVGVTPFSTVTIPSSISDLDAFIALDGFNVNVVADAVQADNNGSSATAAQGWPT